MLQARKTKTVQLIFVMILLLVGIRSSAILGVGFVQAADSVLADTYPLYLPLMSRDVPNIVFVSQRDGHDEIYSIAQDGSTLTRLTDSPTEKASPKWSPDGSKIAFISSPYGAADLYVMNQDGSDLRSLTSIQADSISYSWSSDNSRIIVASYTRPSRSSLFVVDVSSSKKTYLKKCRGICLAVVTFYGIAAWSPSGERIAYSEGYNLMNQDVYAINSDDMGYLRLTVFGFEGFDWHTVKNLSWSPDGSKLAFQLAYSSDHPEPGTQYSAIYVVNADSTGLTSLIEGRYANDGIYDQPVWSPDGSRIAFVQSFYDSGGNRTGSDIYLMNADGTGVTKLIETLDFTSEPVWSPKGDQIVFSSNREIYLANMDGTGLINLSNHPGGDFAPDWQP